MEQSHKKPYKNFYAKNKGYGASNYEYNSYNSSYQQDGYYKSNNSYNKYSKPRRYYNDHNSYHSSNDHYQSSYQDNYSEGHYTYQEKSQANQGKWLHDKYAENEEKLSSEANTRPTSKPDQYNKPKAKFERRPDRQLYSARNKHTHSDDTIIEESSTGNNLGPSGSTKETANSEATVSSDSRILHDTMEKIYEVKENPSSRGSLKQSQSEDKDKEAPPCEEDKSFLSNVSTAMSDKLKNGEEESGTKDKVGTIEVINSSKEVDQKVVFSASFKMDSGVEKISFTEDTTDYEELLDRMCKAHNIDKRMSLYLKINVLNVLFERHPNRNQVKPIYEKYLDINGELVLYENGFDVTDDNIRQYIYPDERN